MITWHDYYCGIIFCVDQYLWIVGFLLIPGDLISWMSVFSNIINLSKFVFVIDLNSWGRASHKYHKN